MIAAAPITIEIRAVTNGKRDALIQDVRVGLGKAPKELPPRWFYDDRGSELFEEITRLPEYYQTRTEAEILTRHADAILGEASPQTIVELGAGASTKTRILIAAGRRVGGLKRFVPFDVSEAIVQRAAHELIQEFPGLTVHAVIGDFSDHLKHVPRFGAQLIIFLGSTIGNFEDQERLTFLRMVRGLLASDDCFLVGVDLVKDPGELIAAYDDDQGVTAAFNRNILAVLNRELEADFDLHAFDHVALWDARHHRIEMHLRSRQDQLVRIPGAGMEVLFKCGEMMRTEISVKFTREGVEACLSKAGMSMRAWHTDSRERFAVALAGPR